MFSSWLKQSRRALGLTQRELGRAVGAGRSTVGMWERGKRVPSPKNIAGLSAFFAEQGIKMPPLSRRPEPTERERFRAEIRRAMGR